jgi:hypothetical protein
MDKVVHLGSRTVMGKVFVAGALGCLFGCGAKNGTTENTTSADAGQNAAHSGTSGACSPSLKAGNMASRERSCELTVNRGKSKGAFDL